MCVHFTYYTAPFSPGPMALSLCTGQKRTIYGWKRGKGCGRIHKGSRNSLTVFKFKWPKFARVLAGGRLIMLRLCTSCAIG